MTRALVAGDVLGDLDAGDACRAGSREALLRGRNPCTGGLGSSCPVCGGVAQLVAFFAIEPEPAVHARAGARACDSRARATRSRRESRSSGTRPIRRNASRMISPLSRTLPLVGDVGEDIAAAPRIAGTSRRSGDGGQHIDVSTQTRRPLSSRSTRARDALARNRAPHEHDLPLMPRQHASAGGGLFDVER